MQFLMVRGGVIVGLTATLLAACASTTAVTQAPALRTIDTPFSAAELAWSKAPGNNRIVGTALLRTVGGEAKTCAGLRVALAPESRYTHDRMLAIYGNADHAFLSAANVNPQRLQTPPEYAAFARSVSCDVQGNFEFGGLPDGAYYVVSIVSWGSPSSLGIETQGGALMQRIEVKGGETKRVVLAP